MKKFIVFLFVIGVIASTPYFIGEQIEARIQDQVQQFDDLPFYIVQIKDYDRGYIRSRVTIRLGVNDELVEEFFQGQEGLPSKGGSFDAYVNVQHGPVLFDNGFGLGWADFSGAIDRASYPKWKGFFDALGKDMFYAWAARVGFEGQGWVKSDIPDQNATFEADDQETYFSITGYEDYLSFTGYGQSFVSDYSVDELSLKMTKTADTTTDPSLELDVVNMRGDAEFAYQGSAWLGIGSAQIAFEKLVGRSAQAGQNIRMDDLYLYADIDEGSSSETLSIRESIQIQSGDFNGYLAEDMEFTFSYENITKALLEAQITEQELFLPDESGQISDEAQTRLENLLKDAARRDPTIALEKVSFSSNDGLVDMSASVKLNSALLPTTIDFNNPLSMLPALGAFADIEVSESLIRTIMILKSKSDVAGLPDEERPTDQQIEELVDTQIAFGSAAFVEQGFLTFEEGKYSTLFSYDKGNATLNGKLIPLGIFN